MTNGPRVTACLYPWDVIGDPSVPARIENLGADSVVLAAAYHTTRAATPQHPDRRVVEARHSALYLPVRPSAWSGSELVPAAATEWTGEENSFGHARDILTRAGIDVDAWVVLTHNSLLGARHPELTVRNAFGDRYGYALCPANAAVRRYAALLVHEVAEAGRPSGLVVEACGPLGFGHLSHHDKTAGADWTAVDEQLLSVCFCAGCAAEYTAAGLDPEQLAAAVRQALGGAAASIVEALDKYADAVLAVREGMIAALRDEVIGVARAAGITRLMFHATADPWATGPAAAVAGAQDAADGYIAGCWGPAPAAVESVRSLRAVAGPQPRIGAYVTILPPQPQDAAALAAHWTTLLDGGVDELHVYHAGLASAARIAAASEAIGAIRRERT